MTDQYKSDHYRNRRNGVHYHILKALPDPIRLSKPGKAYWKRVIRGNYSHFHCDPTNQCTYCKDHTNLSRLDKLRYRIERTFNTRLGK